MDHPAHHADWLQFAKLLHQHTPRGTFYHALEIAGHVVRAFEDMTK